MHTIKAAIITCIDFRFQTFVEDWIKKNEYSGQHDRISIAGACKDIIKPVKDIYKESLLRQLDISVSLHHPEKIILMDHEDCGAFKEDNTIPDGTSFEIDKESHVGCLKHAKELLQNTYADKIIETYYIHLSGEIELIQ